MIPCYEFAQRQSGQTAAGAVVKMRFLYVAPRYHTNQMDIVKGLRDNGDEVKFIVHYKSAIEDYSDIEPEVIGYSPLYRFIDFMYVHVIKRKDPEAIVFKIKYGFPSYHKLKKAIRNFDPDVVIVREKSMYSMFAYLACKKYGYSCILYNQTPFYSATPVSTTAPSGIKHRISSSLFPQYRMTPVLGKCGQDTPAEKYALPTDRYIPFVVNPEVGPDRREYIRDGVIHILSIGKYELRKHHLEMLTIVKHIHDTVTPDIFLTLVGEATNDFQKGYLDRVYKFVRENGMDEYVSVEANVPRKDMDRRYLDADIYVIPSTRETASVSQLEAMSYSLPVICSDTNGTSCYVEEGRTGYLFKDCDMADLEEKILNFVSHPDRIKTMGAAGFETLKDKYNFDTYYSGIKEMIGRIEGNT